MSSLPVLVLNSGSSSIKFSVYEAGDGVRTKLHEGAVDGIGTDLGSFWIKDGAGKSWWIKRRHCRRGLSLSSWLRMLFIPTTSLLLLPLDTAWSLADRQC